MTEEYVNVYRVEKRGRGPFRDYGGLMSNHLPDPWMDAGLPEMTYTELSKYRFGAPNETVLKEWIKLPHTLGNAGFKVSLYTTIAVKRIIPIVEIVFISIPCFCLPEVNP